MRHQIREWNRGFWDGLRFWKFSTPDQIERFKSLIGLVHDYDACPQSGLYYGEEKYAVLSERWNDIVGRLRGGPEYLIGFVEGVLYDHDLDEGNLADQIRNLEREQVEAVDPDYD